MENWQEWKIISQLIFYLMEKIEILNLFFLIWTFSGNSSNYVSILPPPPTHLVSKRKHLANPTHPPFCLRNIWMVPYYSLRWDTLYICSPISGLIWSLKTVIGFLGPGKLNKNNWSQIKQEIKLFVFKYIFSYLRRDFAFGQSFWMNYAYVTK